jgi:DNA-binding MarR family transcriptional regulator
MLARTPQWLDIGIDPSEDLYVTPSMTPRQGQFLAFIHLYQKLHRRPPAEHELCTYFRLTPPSVHDAIVRMEKAGLIARTPHVPRSIRILVPPEDIPPLEDE